MTTREKLDYRAQLDEKLDYRDEKTEGKEEHQTEHPNSSYQAANQHMVKFNDELKAINEKTAMDFEFQKNPAEYDLAERKTGGSTNRRGPRRRSGRKYNAASPRQGG